MMVRTALNAITDEWETFVQSILGRADLPDWDNFWSILRQEELCRFTKRQHSPGLSKVKKEDEEHAALASKKQPKKKKDLSKIKCADLLDWDNLWSVLRQEELRRFTKKQHNSGSSTVK